MNLNDILSTLRGNAAALKESAKQFRLTGDHGHAGLAEAHSRLASHAIEQLEKDECARPHDALLVTLAEIQTGNAGEQFVLAADHSALYGRYNALREVCGGAMWENAEQRRLIRALADAITAVHQRCPGVHQTDQETGETFAHALENIIATAIKVPA